MVWISDAAISSPHLKGGGLGLQDLPHYCYDQVNMAPRNTVVLESCAVRSVFFQGNLEVAADDHGFMDVLDRKSRR